VKDVNFDDCSVYRTVEKRFVCGHGPKIHHNFLLHKDSLTGINLPVLHSRADRTKFGAQHNRVSKHPTQKGTRNFPTQSILLLYIA